VYGGGDEENQNPPENGTSFVTKPCAQGRLEVTREEQGDSTSPLRQILVAFFLGLGVEVAALGEVSCAGEIG
jgi:hypothetical protein